MGGQVLVNKQPGQPTSYNICLKLKSIPVNTTYKSLAEESEILGQET